jgi:hypothetical protein
MKDPRSHHDRSYRSNIPLLTCAFLAALTTGGPIYAFGLYGAELKATLELTQSQLDTISSTAFCAGLISWIPGLMVDHLGVRLSLMLGGSLGATFMMAYWAVARKLVEVHHDIILPALCVLGILIFVANSLVTGSIFKLIVATCAPHTRGSVVGAAKGYVGLGSGVYACLFHALRTPNIRDLDFLPLAAVLVLLAAFLPAVVLLPSREKLNKLINNTPTVDMDQTTSAHLRCLYGGLVMLASMVIITTLAALFGDDYDSDTYAEEASYNTKTEPIQQTPHFGKAALILLAWLGPILTLMVLPPKSRLFHENKEYQVIGDAQGQGEGYEFQQAIKDEDEDDDDEGEFKPLVKTHSSPALAYGAEITESIQVEGPRGLLGKLAVKESTIGSSSSQSSLASSSSDPNNENEGGIKYATNPTRGRHRHRELPNLNLQQMLQTAPAWLFCWITVIRVGGGTMVTNNMGQMVESLKLPKQTTTPAALALFSVAQGFSRVATGAASDWALSWKFVHDEFDDQSSARGNNNGRPTRLQLIGLPRPAFLIVASLSGTFAHLFMSIATTRNWFLVGVSFSGAAFGMIWPLMVLIVGEVFGTKSMGQNYMFYDGLAGALGTLLLSKYVTQDVYEDHIVAVDASDDDEVDGRTCYGRACFHESHIIIACLSFTCVLASYWFYHLTRRIYATRVSEQ